MSIPFISPVSAEQTYTHVQAMIMAGKLGSQMSGSAFKLLHFLIRKCAFLGVASVVTSAKPIFLSWAVKEIQGNNPKAPCTRTAIRAFNELIGLGLARRISTGREARYSLDIGAMATMVQRQNDEWKTGPASRLECPPCHIRSDTHVTLLVVDSLRSSTTSCETEEPAATPPDASIDSEPEAMGDSKATAAARGGVEGVSKFSATVDKPKKKKADGDDPPPTDGADLLFRLYLGLVNRVRPDFRGHDLLRRQLAGIEIELEKALPRNQWADYLDFANQKFGEMTDGKTLPVNNIVGRGKWIVDFATSGPRRVLSLDDVLKKLWYALGYRGDPRMPVNAAKKIMAGKPLSEISPDLREAAQWVVDHYAEFKTVRVDE